MGVFPANHINKFKDYKLLISEKKGKYQFLIANTDSTEKKRYALVEHIRH